MTDNEIIKALKCCGSYCCNECAYFNDDLCIENMSKKAIDLINRKNAELDKKDTEIDILIRKKEALNDEISELKAEIERLQGFYKPTETSGYKIENGKVVFYTNLLNGYRHEYKDLEEVVKELNMMLQRCYLYDDNTGYFKSKIKELRTEKNEAIKDFWGSLKEISYIPNLSLTGEYVVDVSDGERILKEMTEGVE